MCIKSRKKFICQGSQSVITRSNHYRNNLRSQTAFVCSLRTHLSLRYLLANAAITLLVSGAQLELEVPELRSKQKSFLLQQTMLTRMTSPSRTMLPLRVTVMLLPKTMLPLRVTLLPKTMLPLRVTLLPKTMLPLRVMLLPKTMLPLRVMLLLKTMLPLRVMLLLKTMLPLRTMLSHLRPIRKQNNLNSFMTTVTFQMPMQMMLKL